MPTVRTSTARTQKTQSKPKAKPARTTAEPSGAAPKKTGWSAKAGQKPVRTTGTKAVEKSQAEALAPAVNRAFLSLANQLGVGGDAKQVALEATKDFMKSPEAMAAFKTALPWLEKNAVKLGDKTGAEVVGRVATNALPLLASGGAVKALLKAAHEVGGPSGRRLVGAALRGLNSGKGMVGAGAEIAATAAKMGAKAGALGGAVAKALPLVGNAMNLISVGSSLKSLIDVFRDPGASNGQKLSRVLHLACTVGGCFIPQAGLVASAIDVGSVFV